MRHMVHRYFNLWKAFFKNSLSRDMEFKMNFISELVIDAVYYGSLYFLFQIIFSYVNTLGDFNKDAVIIFLIVMYLTDSVNIFFLGGNTFNLNSMVVKGDLDFVLIRPINPQFFVSLRYVMSYSIISTIILFCILLKLIYAYHGSINIFNFAFFIFSFIAGVILFYCIEFLVSCLVFWYRNFSLGGWLSSEMLKYSRRPDSIYTNWFRRITFTVFPMALISSVPARILIFGLDVKIFLLQISITSIFLLLTHIVWNRGLKLYESASS